MYHINFETSYPHFVLSYIVYAIKLQGKQNNNKIIRKRQPKC